MRSLTFVFFVVLGVVLSGLMSARERMERVEAEIRADLEEAEAKYRVLVEESLVGVYIIQGGRFLYVNPRMAEIFGYSQEEIVSSKTVPDLVAPESRTLVMENLRKRIENEEQSIRYSFQAVRKDGSAIDVEVHGARAFYRGQAAVIGSLLDITEQKRAEESLRVTQFALDHASDPVEWIGRDARFRYVNEATCRALGYSSQEMLSMTVWDIDPLVTKEDWDERWTAIETQGSLTFESVHRTKQGRDFPVEITITHMDFGGQQYLCAFARNITQRKKTEEQMQLRYERERTIADTLQTAYLPKLEPTSERFAVYQRYQAALPEAQIGGDFYDVYSLHDRRTGLIIGDVSGKGLEAALHTTMARHTLRAYAHEDPDPAQVLQRVDRTVSDYLPEDHLITVFYGILDEQTGTLDYANAGHEPPIVYRKSQNSVTSLEVTGCAIGCGGKCAFGRGSLRLDPGDILLAYTDGISEARDGGRFFGIERIMRTLHLNASGDEKHIVDAVFDAAAGFSGGELHDDAVVLVVKAK